jgi:hypothetical protein
MHSLLPFIPDTFSSIFFIENHEDWNIEKYNFVCRTDANFVSLLIREELRPGFFENMVQRKIIATKTKEAKKNCLMKISLLAHLVKYY